MAVAEQLKEAQTNIAQGDLFKAQEALKKALEAEPENPDVLLAMGDLALRMGEMQAGVDFLQEAANRDATPKRLAGVARVLEDNGEFGLAYQALQEAHKQAPEDTDILLRLGILVSTKAGDYKEARQHLEKVLEQDPENAVARNYYRHAMAAGVTSWHFRMMNDDYRNGIYREAIEKHVKPGMHVLEVGTGAGLLAMMAARAGADHVTTIEMVPEVAEKARKVIQDNGLSDKITVLNQPSYQVSVGRGLAEPADLLVSEILSSDLICEDVLVAIPDAAKRLLKEGAPILPRGGAVMAALVNDNKVAKWTSVREVEGFDLSALNTNAPHVFHIPNGVDYLKDMPVLSGDVEAFQFDFTKPFEPVKTTVNFPVTGDGTAIGFIQWIKVNLDDDLVYENHYTKNYDPSGWEIVYYNFEEPQPVRKGQTVSIPADVHADAFYFDLKHVDVA